MADTGLPVQDEAPSEDRAPSERVIKGVGSVVTLNYDEGVVHKRYKPRFAVRALYWLAFQAPFPYSSDRDSLEACRYRRIVVAFLTKFWFGIDMVAPVLDIAEDESGDVAFVTRLVRGREPENKLRARKFLKVLTNHFLESGMPTWQVTPHNPRAVGNLIEVEDGSYRIIDLESNLVAALTPMSAVLSAVRQKNFPNFDDIDADRLESYLSRHEKQLREKLGSEDYLKLMDAAIAYHEYATRWHSREPRIVGKTLKYALKPLNFLEGTGRFVGKILTNGQLRAEAFIRRGIDQWAHEGRLTAAEAAALRQALRKPDVARALNHLGINIAIAIALFAPLSSIVKFSWTVGNRLRAEFMALIGKNPAIHEDRQIHTLLVAVVGMIPGLGGFNYLLAKPLRSNRALAVIAFDKVLRKVPFKVYRRLHLGGLMTRLAHSGRKPAPAGEMPEEAAVEAK